MGCMTFKDHFSGHAEQYAAARPDYPQALFDWLADSAPGRELAWDCATGNGQAARGLAGYFRSVIASDASAAQIESASSAAGIEFRVFAAEAPQLETGSVDLVTVAQALHWFDLPRFYAACDRVLRPGGVLAVWSYGLCDIEAAIDAWVGELYEGVLGSYWPPERRLVEERYAGVDFPYPLLQSPALNMEKHWTREQFKAYLESWSATQSYRRERGEDPLQAMAASLESLWSSGLEKAVSWPLVLLAGRKPRQGTP